MSPLQIASVIVLVTFVALLVAGTRYGTRRRRMAPIRRAAPPPTGSSASIAGDHRAGGARFRADALAAAEDPIVGQVTERSRA